MTSEEQGGKTASEEPPTRLYLSAYQGQFFDEDVEYMRLEMIAKQAEDRATRIRHGVPSVSWDLKGEEQRRVAANALVRFAREIRGGAHHEGEQNG